MKTRQILGRKVYEKSRPFQYKKKHFVALLRSTVPTRFLPLTVSVIVRVRGKLVRLELEVTC